MVINPDNHDVILQVFEQANSFYHTMGQPMLGEGNRIRPVKQTWFIVTL